MKKKLMLGICTLAIALSLVACGSKEPVTYGGMTESDFQQTLQYLMMSLDSVTEADVDYYIESAEAQKDKLSAEMLAGWKVCLKDNGDFVDFKSFALDKSGKTLTATLISDYTGRDVKLVFVYNVNRIEEGPTAVNVEPVYTLGETMQKAGLNTVMGILIVFTMLVVMSLVISCFKLIPNIQAKFAGKKEEPKAEAAVVAAPVATATDDLELIAVIAAAIAASTGASTDSFVVRSIKKRF